MVITQQDKEAIAAKARKRAADYSLSQSEVAAQSGVSKTIITWMFSEDKKWKGFSISDKQWRNIAYWSKYDFNEQSWKVVRTNRNFKRFYNMVDHAHEAQMMSIISDMQGRGKSTALKAYRDDNPKSAFYLECDPSFYQSVLLRKLGALVGVDSPVRNIAEAIDEIVDKLLSMNEPPILLFDEWNELPDGSKRIQKTLWNRTEGRVAFVICGGQNLQHILNTGVNKAKQSFQEIWSRGGSKTLNAGKLTQAQIAHDVTQTCLANGVQDEDQIFKTINNFTGDFREVKRMCEDYWRQQRKASKNDNTRQLQLQEAI